MSYFVPCCWRDQMIGSMIELDDFLKVHLRVGTIVAVEKIERSKKLLKLQVDFGEFGVRQVLSGIAETFQEPSTLVGFQALFVTNLAPRKLMGLESCAMIVAVKDTEGKTVLFGHFGDKITNGALAG